MAPQPQKLLREVAFRRAVILLGRRAYYFALIAGGVFAVLLLCSRLLALIPNWFSPASICLVPLVGVGIAAILQRRVTVADAARLADVKAKTHDLFLATAVTSQADGDYHPVMQEQAEAVGKKVRANAVAPFFWEKKTLYLAIVLGLLAVGVRYLPQLDPLGKGKQRTQASRLAEALKASEKATELRKAILESSGMNADQEQVEKAITKLEKTFQAAKPQTKEATLAQLGESQKELGGLWQKLSEEKLKSAFSSDTVNQSFGSTDAAKTSEWKTALEKGDVSAIQKEINDLRAMAKHLANMPDSAEKQKLREQMRQRISQLADAASKQLGSPALNAAASRALEQMQMAQDNGLSKQAMEAVEKSLQLSEEEMAKMGQNMKDLQSLEKALKSMQMARQLAKDGKLDGSEDGDAASIDDYAALFEKSLAEKGDGNGVGQGGGNNGGRGAGGEVDYDESSKTRFKTEQSKSALHGGRMLMEWKSNGVSESGEAAKGYRDALQQVQQGVSEAIAQEQVPPGYHEAIRKYFDGIEQKPGDAPKK